MITKKAENRGLYRRAWQYTDSARAAWSKIIAQYKVNHPAGKILLPSYIGWSANEGSGIFDSVKESGLEFAFYELDARLEINFSHLKEQVSKDTNQLVLLVHYFGFTDSKYNEICEWLAENNIAFVEDCAHAWLTDLVGGSCGRRGSYAFYSLHKLLPVESGGVMVNNFPDSDVDRSVNPFFDLGYDLYKIYSIRRSNYIILCNLLKNIKGIDVVYKELQDGICPQTLPVIVENYDRSKLYHEMNEKGYGMVSLYHTMITQLTDSPFGAAADLSKRIINFPIHQDVSEGQLINMAQELNKILNA
ncbi:DegT/DnrJ/EryC1/StrS family aminotransferase [Chryseobacterium sp.]|uniref:DegT/DnrJ/EryC1/StrS family aminotransferase n=1 Tax=Chryseobacterium sp. TaxID=1871047 RepID=UPI0011C80BE2|nr:DegT/DnrJ/EryC1/StrS family aminotransferase [Chryseobacterium sp.]TXF77541.1 DegT/DnrJ/EryC1/StrS aminotransferase family protein [Chryseobacterium sp.]